MLFRESKTSALDKLLELPLENEDAYFSSALHCLSTFVDFDKPITTSLFEEKMEQEDKQQFTAFITSPLNAMLELQNTLFSLRQDVVASEEKYNFPPGFQSRLFAASLEIQRLVPHDGILQHFDEIVQFDKPEFISEEDTAEIQKIRTILSSHSIASSYEETRSMLCSAAERVILMEGHVKKTIFRLLFRYAQEADRSCFFSNMWCTPNQIQTNLLKILDKTDDLAWTKIKTDITKVPLKPIATSKILVVIITNALLSLNDAIRDERIKLKLLLSKAQCKFLLSGLKKHFNEKNLELVAVVFLNSSAETQDEINKNIEIGRKLRIIQKAYTELHARASNDISPAVPASTCLASDRSVATVIR